MAPADTAVPATAGMLVAFHYRLSDEDGDELDITTVPLRTILGSHRIVPGLEQALFGRSVDERFRLDLPPSLAYGERDEADVRQMPRAALPADAVLARGVELQALGDDGSRLQAWVVEADDETVVIDFNHPFAGMPVTFEVAIVEVRRPTLAEIAELR